MNKVFGNIEDFALIKEDASRIVVSYEYEKVDEDNATWYEVYFYKKQVAKPTISQVKEAVFADINKQTDEKIVSGFVWNSKPVWLSEENQKNFSEGQRVAQMTEGQSLPVKYKLGEDENGEPVYHTFTTLSSITDFYLKGVQYINQTLNEGWTRKDAIDWQPYEDALAPVENEPTENEEA